MKTKGRKQVTRLKYAVKAEWGQPARGAKKEVAELTGLFKAIKDDIYNSLAGNVTWNGKPIDTLTESDINKSQFLRESRPRINVATQFEIFPRFVALPLPEYKKYLKRYYVTQNFYSKKISAWPPSRFTPLANYVEMKDADLLLLLEAVCADKSGNWQDSTVEELQARLDENLQLWDCEEKLVPLKLNVVAKWVQGGKEGGITPRIVPIDLPNEFDAPFNARKDLY